MRWMMQSYGNNEMGTTHMRIRRLLLVAIGIFSILVSVFSFLLSLAMPGVGWAMAALALIAASALTPFLGKRYVIITLVVSSVHLFTFGPLSVLHQSSGTQGSSATLFLVIFVILPVATALVSIFTPNRLFRSRSKN